MRLLLLLSSLSILLTGCALKNRTISLTANTFSPTPIKLLNTPISISIEDLRLKPDVGYAENILGMKIARILLDKPLKETLSQSLENSLQAQGYSVTQKTPNTLDLNIAIHECYTKYDERIFREKAITDLDLTVTSFNSQNQVVLVKKIHTQGRVAPFLFITIKTVQKAINQALDKAIDNLLQEENLFQKPDAL